MAPARRSTLARTAAAVTATAALLLPLATAHASAAPARALPDGVVQLGDGQACPSALLCMYRDYNYQGPAYGVSICHDINLYDLPMSGGNGTSAAKNISSWMNNNSRDAILWKGDDIVWGVHAGQGFNEHPETNDTVDRVTTGHC